MKMIFKTNLLSVGVEVCKSSTLECVSQTAPLKLDIIYA